MAPENPSERRRCSGLVVPPSYQLAGWVEGGGAVGDAGGPVVVEVGSEGEVVDDVEGFGVEGAVEDGVAWFVPLGFLVGDFAGHGFDAGGVGAGDVVGFGGVGVEVVEFVEGRRGVGVAGVDEFPVVLDDGEGAAPAVDEGVVGEVGVGAVEVWG